MDLIAISNRIKTDIKRVTPVNYSIDNALQSAYLILLETYDKNRKPALQICTKESVYNALLDMVIQGLNPSKKQCYFVVYGNKLQLIRSYMGSIMVAKQVDSRITDIRSEIIYEGDDLKFEIKNGKKFISQHFQSMDTLKNKIYGAYAIAIDKEEKTVYTDLMLIHEIKESWNSSKQDPNKKDGTHQRFSSAMCKRTVINRLCKTIINTSDDMELLKFNDIIAPEVIDGTEQKIQIDFEKPQPISFDQAKLIHDYEKQANRNENQMFESISSFTNRNITKLRELSYNEADEYISMLESERAPDWANTEI